MAVSGRESPDIEGLGQENRQKRPFHEGNHENLGVSGRKSPDIDSLRGEKHQFCKEIIGFARFWGRKTLKIVPGDSI